LRTDTTDRSALQAPNLVPCPVKAATDGYQ
jgi:hypothetical protein